MKGRSVIDIVERFQTHHSLQEEREMRNFHASTKDAFAPGVSDKSAISGNNLPGTAKVVNAEQPSPIRSTK